MTIFFHAWSCLTIAHRAGTPRQGQSLALPWSATSAHTDDIREELDEAAAAADVDSQLAALKAQLAASPATPELRSGDSPPAGPAKDSNP
jgi:hypothetical protein